MLALIPNNLDSPLAQKRVAGEHPNECCICGKIHVQVVWQLIDILYPCNIVIVIANRHIHNV